MCRCPTGYVGNGEGANGCVQQGPGGATCSAANCMNGQCQVSTITVTKKPRGLELDQVILECHNKDFNKCVIYKIFGIRF